MAYVTVPNDTGYDANAFGGFSFSKLTNWVSNTASAIASKDSGRITAQLTQAIPTSLGAKPAAVKPVVAPSPFAPGGFVDQNKTMLMVVAAGLGAYLLLGKRKS